MSSVKLVLGCLTAAALSACLIGLFLYRKLGHKPVSERWGIALFPLSLVSLLAAYSAKFWDVIFDIHSWIRYQKTFVVALGYPLYYGQDTGPALATIYGPVSVFAFLPATLTHDPFWSLRIACFLAAALYLLPALWIFLHQAKGHPQANLWGWITFACFAFWSLFLTSLRYAAFTVHADAPTLGLSAFACACLLARPRPGHWGWLLASSVAAVLSVWSKQIAVPIVLALPLYVYLADGWQTAKHFTLGLFLTGLVISGFFLLAFDPHAMIFNMFTIPSRHDYRDGGTLLVFLKSAIRLLRETAIMLLIGLPALWPLLRTRAKFPSRADWLKMNPWFLFYFVGLLMAPLAILSNVKVGGSINTLSFGNYFFLLGTLLAFLTWKDLVPGEGLVFWRWKFKPQGTLLLMLVLLMLPGLGTAYYRIAQLPKRFDFAAAAYDYIRKHPGETYFSRLDLLHLLGEGKLYHTVDGLMDRYWADMPIQGKDLNAYLPPNGKYLLFIEENHHWLFPQEEYPVGYHHTEEFPEFLAYPRARTANP